MTTTQQPAAPTGPHDDPANPANWTVRERAIARVAYVGWKARCIARSWIDGGSTWGCCTCGGTSGTWRITGATAMRGVDGEPVEDWTECDRCHLDGETAGEYVGARRDVIPVPDRIASALIVLAFVVALIGAATSPQPFTAALSALLITLAAVAVWGPLRRTIDAAAARLHREDR